MVFLGQNLVKRTTSRRAQVVALDGEHAVVHWPDTNEQTRVKISRLETRRKEWDLEPDHWDERWTR